jgi:hypothetical protein
VRKKDKIMRRLKGFSAVIAIIVVVLLVVILRSGGNQFKPDALKWAEASISGQNFITAGQIESLPGKKLIIDLDGQVMEKGVQRTIAMPPATVLQKENTELIRKNRGPVILSSSDMSVSSRVWMILSQLGIKELYILGDKPEVLVNEIRPDSSGLTP